MELKTIVVTSSIHSCYSIKHPLYSATQPTTKVFTPTSLLGALAYPLNVFLKRSEVVEHNNRLLSSVSQLLKDVAWTTYRYIDFDPRILIETRDIVRVLIAPYVRAENVYPASPNIWAVQSHGKVCAPTIRVEIMYVVKNV